MTGWTPAFSAATSAARTSGEMPEPPTAQHGGAGEHRRAHDVGRQRLADRAAAAFEQLPLEGAGIAADGGAEIGAEAGVQPVDLLAGGGDLVEHATRPAQRAPSTAGAISTLRACAGDRGDILDADARRR